MSEPVRDPRRCNAVGPAPEHFSCGRKKGHSGQHSAIQETLSPVAPPPSEVAAPGADDDFKAWEAWNAKPWSSAPHRRGGGVKVFGWMVHRGDCHCPNYPKCSVRFDDLMRERAVRDRYEQLFLTEMRKASQLNKLGQRIAAQRRQIRRLKAALRTAGEK